MITNFKESNTYNMNKYRMKDIDENRRTLYRFFTFDIEYIILLLFLTVVCLTLYLVITKIEFKKVKKIRRKINRKANK